MKYLSTYIIIGILMLQSVHAQGVDWVAQTGGNDAAYGRAVVADQHGNVYVNGLYGGKLDLDPGPGVQEEWSQGESAVFIQKLDAQGHLNWVVTLQTASYINDPQMAIDGAGNVIAAGTFSGILTIETPHTSEILEAKGKKDVYLFKLALDGTLIWYKQVGEEYNDEALALAADAEGNIYLAWKGIPPPPSDLQIGELYIPLRFRYIQKLDYNGNKKWNEYVSDDLQALAVDRAGNIIHTGSFKGDDRRGLLSSRIKGAFIGKLSAEGVSLWKVRFQTESDDIGYAVTTDSKGNVYGLGSIGDDLFIDIGGSTLLFNGERDQNIYLTKISPQGEVLWFKMIEGERSMSGSSMVITDNDELFITGYFSGQLDLDPNPSLTKLTSLGNRDCFIGKFDLDGNISWGRNIGGLKGHGRSALFVLNEKIYLIGNVQETLLLDQLGEENLSAIGKQDVIVMQMEAGGVEGPDYQSRQSVYVFPNPTTGKVNIDTFADAPVVSLHIGDYQGRMLIQLDPSEDVLSVDLSALQNGTYFVLARLKDGTTVSQKVVLFR